MIDEGVAENMRKHVKIAKSWCLGISFVTAVVGAQAFEMDRTHLPIAEPDEPKFKELDVRGVEAPPLFSVEAPEGAPNVIICLLYTSPSPRDRTRSRMPSSA